MVEVPIHPFVRYLLDEGRGHDLVKKVIEAEKDISNPDDSKENPKKEKNYPTFKICGVEYRIVRY